MVDNISRHNDDQDKSSKKPYEKPFFEKYVPLESVKTDYYYYRGSERIYWYSN